MTSLQGSRLTGLTYSKAPGFWMVEHQLVTHAIKWALIKNRLPEQLFYLAFYTSNLIYYLLNKYFIIKTHGSESRGQEEAGLCDEPVSYLQVAPL